MPPSWYTPCAKEARRVGNLGMSAGPLLATAQIEGLAERIVELQRYRRAVLGFTIHWSQQAWVIV